jgi:hypothetical protein
LMRRHGLEDYVRFGPMPSRNEKSGVFILRQSPEFPQRLT